MRLYWGLRRNVRWSEWRYRYERSTGFFLRGWRGWAPHDTWCLDNHLARVLSGALRYLAKHHHGVPNEFTERHGGDIDKADAEWTQWLLDKAEWFDWYVKDEDGVSDDKGWIVANISGEEKTRRIEAYFSKQKKFSDEVLPDFVKYWGNLWD